MNGNHQVPPAGLQILRRRSPDEQRRHQASCTDGCMNQIPPQVGEVVDYYPNPNGQFHGPSDSNGQDSNRRLSPHFVVVLGLANADDGSPTGTGVGPEYMCCVITSHPPTTAPQCEYLVLEPGNRTGNTQRVSITDIQAVPGHRWQWLPNTQVAISLQRFPQFVLHRLLDTDPPIMFRLDDASIRILMDRLGL